MIVYCVMRDEARTDLDHVVFATTNKDDAERFAKTYNFIDYNGNPNIEVLDVEESEGQRCDTCYHNKTEFSICQYCTNENKYEKRYCDKVESEE